MNKISTEEFLEFAKQDLKQGDKRGFVNAYSNLKRAMHCQIDSILEHFDLNKKERVKNRTFYQKFELIRKLGIMCPESFKDLNQTRNLLEHQYLLPDANDIKALLDLVMMYNEHTNLVLSNIVKHSDKWKTLLGNIAEQKLPEYDNKKIKIEIAETSDINSKLNLSNYPSMFVEDGRFRGLIVVGDKAPAEHVIAVADIISSLQKESVKTVGNNVDVHRINVGAVVLSSEITDLNTNIISIGDPSINHITGQIMKSDLENYRDMGEENFLVKLYDLGNGNTALVVLSTNPQTIRAAGKMFSEYRDYDLQGQEVIFCYAPELADK